MARQDTLPAGHAVRGSDMERPKQSQSARVKTDIVPTGSQKPACLVVAAGFYSRTPPMKSPDGFD